MAVNLFLSTPSARRATFLHSAGVSSFTFLSTPSARRATRRALLQRQQSKHFYPRPPRGGRQAISAEVALIRKFLSTPSARRATFSSRSAYLRRKISIHALREEGDEPRLLHHPLRQVISIHALREEGDLWTDNSFLMLLDFYPRPPRGGRPFAAVRGVDKDKFLSTPSARRATSKAYESDR